jgi:hypothetical protein
MQLARLGTLTLALAATSALMIDLADARVGGGSSAGSPAARVPRRAPIGQLPRLPRPPASAGSAAC